MSDEINKSSNQFMKTKSRVKRIVSKRDISVIAFELENGHVMLESSFLDPYHLIRLNLEIDPKTRGIVEAICELANHPHSMCPSVAEKAKLLIGLTITRGITKEIMNRVGGSEGCVHLRELALDTINFGATVLVGYDEGFGLMSRAFNILDENKRLDLSKHILKNTCHVYKENQK